MDRRLSDTVEDYLKVIYDLSADNQRVGTGQIAEMLGVSPASVTDMFQRLAGEDPPLLDYVKHQGVALTEDGRKAALETIRHHRLLELFLHEVLGYSWDEVHDEAERLEHVICGCPWGSPTGITWETNPVAQSGNAGSRYLYSTRFASRPGRRSPLRE